MPGGDDESAPLNDTSKSGAAGDDEENKEDTCCAQFGRGILAVFKNIFYVLQFVFMTIANLLGLCWYPFKERGGEMCECCGKRMSPHTDPAYGGF